MDVDDSDAAKPDPMVLNEMRQLEREIQTWDLVRRLLPLRSAEAQPTSSLFTAKKKALHDLVDTDPILKERRAVLQWLQTNAASGPDIDELARELQQNADRRHHCPRVASYPLQNQTQKEHDGLATSVGSTVPKRYHVLNSDGAPLVTQLDPDAGHGRRPPASLVLWRRMCLSLARGGGSDDYERAVYGLLSGDIASVEKVAKSWDDFLFANYNALLRTQIDSHLLSQSPPDTVSVLAQSFPSFDAIQFHGELEGVEKRLVTTLESQKSTRDEALEPNKALQASLIARDIDRHLYEQALVLTEDANKDEPSLLLPSIHPTAWNFLNDKGDLVRHKFFGLEQHEGLRIACHIYVLIALLRQFDALEGKVQDQLTTSHWRSGQESIIAGYTDYLARANLKELIPLYCSILRSPRQYEVLSWNMIHEQNADRRMTQLKLIKRVGIDVLKFVETLAKLVFDKLDHTNDTFTAKESFSIMGRATYSSAWACIQVFLQNTHLLAARRLMERVQFDAILQNVSEQEVDLGVFDDVDFWAQQLDQSGIASAVPEQVMTDARNYRELEHLARALDSLETMGSLMRLSKEAPPGDRTFWSGVGDAVKVMKDRMQPLLGSWLLTSIEG
ncbi:nuclear pore protein [Hirsutella rhossiliensis]|uniref:Nuclear pore complex protein n=1 Tax=Hirsutella rhossiliensis TaxID=111463 RepID=A0A9P8MSI2_9HYPO|nr:nuclear pore protein [Hirsutella rhossiliensis]KAH0960617.1 nuclear pore protein [Hirsutella rhossiliensis]